MVVVVLLLGKSILSFYFPHECIQQYLNEFIFPFQLSFAMGSFASIHRYQDHGTYTRAFFVLLLIVHIILVLRVQLPCESFIKYANERV